MLLGRAAQPSSCACPPSSADEVAGVVGLDRERHAGAGRWRNISTTASLGVPNTWMLVVESTVSAYALAARSATTRMWNAIEAASG